MATGVLYATIACPYAHRALLALALRPVPGFALNSTVPTKNQLGFLDNIGRDPMGILTGEASVAELHDRKAWYNREILASGETPALQLSSGEVVSESEIVAEYIDAVSCADKPRLVPFDPVLAARVRRSMKAFNAVPGAMVKVLQNQRAADDDTLITALDAALTSFTATLEGGGNAGAARLCHGQSPTLADVHAGCHLWRLGLTTGHYRGYSVAGRHPRAWGVVEALQQLPEWAAVLRPQAVTPEKLVTFYEQYANANLWGDAPGGGRALVGRGVSRVAAL